ncbi:hypothetical protein ACGF5F_27475 [Streptomyces sp. NPDC047821]|uniref:hypothetical protein n=1 Tax=unclassified Streptomyces TaxID=2593676 RepID=UPI003631D58F
MDDLVDAAWTDVLALAVLAGIGFTVALPIGEPDSPIRRPPNGSRQPFVGFPLPPS